MVEIAMVNHRRSVRATTMGILRRDSNSESGSQGNNNNNQNNNNGGDKSSSRSDNNNNNNGNNHQNNNGNNNNNNGNNNRNDNNNNGNNFNNNNNDAGSKGKSVDSSVPMEHNGSKGGSKNSGNKAVAGNGDSLNVPLIAGVAAGVGVFILIMIIVCIVCCCKKKKKKKDGRLLDSAQYYKDSQHPSQYSGQYPPQWSSNPQEMNYSSATGMSSQHRGPAMMPPPPPPMMSTDMMSTGNYSSGPTGPALPPPHPTVALGFNKSTFTYDELATATGGFAQGNLLGQGGFGFVHKGVLPNGKEIAVKSLKSGSGQGEREFQAEVDIISRVHHRYLVSLVGYCIAGGQRMLVYEFVPNGTLEFHLHGRGRPVMDFPTRMKIALGSAKGLAYLHEDCHPRIIHRDIKTANILLDFNFEAQVADFGLAKLSSDTYTHVSTRVMGTFGYLAPEYAASGKLTEKSDVFSYGVMLLELVTGKRPIDPDAEEDTLVDWARPLIGRAMDEGIFNGLVDPKLEGQFDSAEMLRLLACAGASIRHSAKRRPKMSQIVRVLEGDVSLDDLNGAVKQGSNATLLSTSSESDYDTRSYQNDMERFRKTAFDSTDYTSSEYRGTSDYGHSSGESAPRKPSPNSRNFL